jgi:hypothetical protein
MDWIFYYLSALQTLHVCLSGSPNRRKQPERYTTYRLIFFENIKHIKKLYGKMLENELTQ